MRTVGQTVPTPHRKHIIGVLVVLLVVAAAGVSYYVQVQRANSAERAYLASLDDDRPWSARVSSASEAVRLVPDSVSYRQQEASLLAEGYARIGSLAEARRLLIDAWALDRSNTELREQLREVNLEIQALDTWKAHIQHQREGPKGELDPEDVIP